MEVTGHRGAPAYAPENTLKSFGLAIKMGVDAIEMDVHLTRDKEIVVIHDPSVDRTTDGTGMIRDLQLGQIQKLRTAEGEQVPTLQEVIDLAYGKVTLQIELKGEGTETAVAKLIKRYDPNNFFLISFWHARVLTAKSICPDVKTGVLLEGLPLNVLDIVDSAKAERLAIKYDTIDKETVDLLQSHGKTVSAWVVDDPNYIKNMVSMGIDSITSNKPNVVLRLLGR